MRRLEPCALALLVAAAGFLIDPARANDTYAELVPGGLRFEKTDKIRMEREALVIDPDRVTVAYVFRNVTDQDARAEVAFPLPDIDMASLSETPHVFHTSTHPGDVFDFRLSVDGKPAAARFDVHAIGQTGNRDVTALLRKYNVPLVDAGEGGADPQVVMQKLDPAAIAALAAGGAVFKDDPDRHPNWTVRAAYHWTQSFPAHGQVEIAHEYKPVLGGGLRNASSLADPKGNGLPPGFCGSPEAAAEAAKLPGHAADNTMEQGGPLVMRWLSYVLSTGANWAGPIGQFSLEIKQGKADIVSPCPIPGLSLRRQDRSLIGEAADFMPRSDIKLLYVYGYCSEQDCTRR